MAEAATPIKRKPANRVLGPKPAYILVNLPDGVSVSDVEIVGVVRKAEEALEAIDTKRAGNYLRILVK